MDNKHIWRLIEAFYEGAATAGQEEQLRQLLGESNGAAESMEAEKAYLEAYTQATDVTLPDGLDWKLADTIRNAAVQSEKAAGKRLRPRRALYWGAAVAAFAAAVMLAIPDKPAEYDLTGDTFDNPEEAAAAAMAAITLMSEQWNKGMEQVSEAALAIEKAKSIMNEENKK